MDERAIELNGRQKLIIDGYNVIYTDDDLRRTACKHLQTARERLIDLLKGYVNDRRVQVTVVFDGRGGMADAESILPGSLQVVFSAAGQTADELILSAIRRSGNPRAYVVVSSDMADIGRAARELGCEVMGSKRFLDRLTGRGRREARDMRGPAEGDFGETDYWLKEFKPDADNSED